MKAEDYVAAVHLIGAAARVIEGIDLAGVVAAMDRAETLGPIIDPTLYRDFLFDDLAQLDWRTTGELARAMLPVQQIVREFRAGWNTATHGKET